ncbi:MAG: tRNA (N(6)-L-threonylcarbamoyladenosine(37)-C(2))-methylthiotransferase MtaB, partial [Pelagibacterales bacterium]|nr:tRNA (N(6)-L-threonylcarbamoyladenosine(37)-C(2))-methylthiotransferase MtaB [Pelagibacterales bacterium]
SYSERENTEAILLNGYVEKHKRSERSKALRIMSSKLQRLFYQNYEKTYQNALFEQENKDGYLHGFTDNYIKIKVPYNQNLLKTTKEVFLSEIDNNLIMNAKIKELCIQQ